jgi:hypothetical protein
VRDRVIYIRCSEETRKRLKLLRDRLGLASYEDTLRYLLDMAERYEPRAV